MTTITRADPSPQNRARWHLTLKCGHKVWKSTTHPPKIGSRVRCQLCADDAAGLPTAEEVRVEGPNEETWKAKIQRLNQIDPEKEPK